MFANRLDLEELVVLGDSMMRRDRRLKRATLDDFQQYIDRATQWCKEQPHRQRSLRGLARCRMALRLMRENTDSSQESHTRLALERYQLNGLRVNYPIRAPETNAVMLLDMAYPELHIAIEYDGKHHASQWLADSDRRSTIEDMKWIYFQVTMMNIGDAEREAALATRVLTRINERFHTDLTLPERLSIEQLADGRRLRGRPLWSRLGLPPAEPTQLTDTEYEAFGRTGASYGDAEDSE